MTTTRRYLLAPSIARLLARECGSIRIAEGHFATPERKLLVRTDGEECCLVLSADGDAEAGEQRVTIPEAQAEALLAVCGGTVVYERSRIAMDGGREVVIDRFVVPGSLDTVEVGFADRSEADGFKPPCWFGEEITGERNCDNQAIALHNLSLAVEVPLTNATLEAVLDLVDRRALSSMLGRDQRAPERAEAAAPETQGLHAAVAQMSRAAGGDETDRAMPETEGEMRLSA